MEIPKAIEILSESAYHGSTTHNQDFKDALKLSIEALKREMDRRRSIYWAGVAPLPGETQRSDNEHS